MDSARSPPASDPPRRAQGLNSRQAPIRLTVDLEEGEMGFGLPPAEKAGRAGVPMGQQNTNIYTHADTHTRQRRRGGLTSLECPMVMMKSK